MAASLPARTEARAPGKLILSGEHAVVHGAPALVTAVDLEARTAVTPRQPGIELVLPGWARSGTCSFAEARLRARHVEARFAEFLDGARPVEEVVPRAEDLLLYASMLELPEEAAESNGLRVEVDSSLPAGCGMGSSAAVISTILLAVSDALGRRLDPVALFEQTLAVEKLQHGRPSGVDPYVVVHGGCHRFRAGEAEATVPLAPSAFRLVNTGRPASTTGECVMQVSRQFGDSDIWGPFAETTLAMERALRDEDEAAFAEAVRANHRLLVRIGVVPEAVQRFVAEVEKRGGAAKVCGAGSVRGDRAGVVLVVGVEPAAEACRALDYERFGATAEPRGARLTEAGREP